MGVGVTISPALPTWRVPAARTRTADLFVVLIALALPWSTSLVAIFAAVWLVTVVPTLDIRFFMQTLKRPICALPIALFALAAVGTFWSDAPWGSRLYAISPTVKLLVLPLLFYHFERSPRGMWVFLAFLVSCSLLMAMSWIVAFDPRLALKSGAAVRRPGQKLYRPEPGICLVRDGPCLSDHDFPADGKDSCWLRYLPRSH